MAYWSQPRGDVRLGVFQLGILERDYRFRPRLAGGRPHHSLALGMAFAGGFAPCVGPILGAILVMAATTDTVWQGIFLLSAYSLGMGAPFLVLALFLGRSQGLIATLARHGQAVSRAAGGLLILIGVLLFFNLFQQLAGYGDYYLVIYQWLGL